MCSHFLPQQIPKLVAIIETLVIGDMIAPTTLHRLPTWDWAGNKDISARTLGQLLSRCEMCSFWRLWSSWKLKERSPFVLVEFEEREVWVRGWGLIEGRLWFGNTFGDLHVSVFKCDQLRTHISSPRPDAIDSQFPILEETHWPPAFIGPLILPLWTVYYILLTSAQTLICSTFAD